MDWRFLLILLSLIGSAAVVDPETATAPTNSTTTTTPTTTTSPTTTTTTTPITTTTTTTPTTTSTTTASETTTTTSPTTTSTTTGSATTTTTNPTTTSTTTGSATTTTTTSTTTGSATTTTTNPTTTSTTTGSATTTTTTPSASSASASSASTTTALLPKLYNLNFTINETFDPNLAIVDSPEFLRKAAAIRTVVEPFYSRKYGNKFWRMKILKFSKGSIVINCILEFLSNPDTTADVLKNTLLEAPANDLGFSVEKNSVSVAPVEGNSGNTVPVLTMWMSLMSLLLTVILHF